MNIQKQIKDVIAFIKNDDGFMGPTHSLSAISFFFLTTALFPQFMFEVILQTYDFMIFIGAIIVVAGYSVLPDLDNTQSTAKSTLGLIGKGLSAIMRGTSITIYHATKTHKDNPKADPHRGFWHTIISGFLIGIIVFLLSSISNVVTIPVLNKDATIGYLFTVLFIYIGYQLFFASLFNSTFKRYKSTITGKFMVSITGIIFALLLIAFAPSTGNYSWLAYCVTLGYIFHIIGDSLTVAGVPLFWPLKHNGRRWWNYRFLKIKAGGEIEKTIIIPLFVGIIVLCLFKFFVAGIR